MKKVCFLILFVVVTSFLFAQEGIVIESLEFESGLLRRPIRYSIYLPSDYGTSTRSYPVLYLIHGYSDDETSWVQQGQVSAIVDKEIRGGTVPPMIIVMPDAKVTWYCNNASGDIPWQDMFINEFVPFAEKKYRIRSNRKFRAIGGNSMGGYGALAISMKNPDLFSCCMALSSAIYTEGDIISMPDKEYAKFGNVYGNQLKGQDRLSANWKANDPISLVKGTPSATLNEIGFYIDCGDDDYLYKGNAEIHILMRNMGIRHEYRVKQGEHGWEYWRESLHEGLKYIGCLFNL